MSYAKTLSAEVAAEAGPVDPGYYVAYSKQEDAGAERYCGAASVQMVLRSIGAELLGQSELFDLIRSLSEVDPAIGWLSAPDGMIRVLNELRPKLFTQDFEIQGFASEVEASRAVCWRMESGVAPIVLLSGGSHWVVVAGYEASRAPTALSDNGYEIFAFEVFDPADNASRIEYERPPTPNAKFYWKDMISAVPLGTWKDQFLVICPSD